MDLVFRVRDLGFRVDGSRFEEQASASSTNQKLFQLLAYGAWSRPQSVLSRVQGPGFMELIVAKSVRYARHSNRISQNMSIEWF